MEKHPGKGPHLPKNPTIRSNGVKSDDSNDRPPGGPLRGSAVHWGAMGEGSVAGDRGPRKKGRGGKGEKGKFRKFRWPGTGSTGWVTFGNLDVQKSVGRGLVYCCHHWQEFLKHSWGVSSQQLGMGPKSKKKKKKKLTVLSIWFAIALQCTFTRMFLHMIFHEHFIQDL